MTKFEEQLEEKTDYELIEIYSSAPDYQPEFIEQVKAHIVKRKIPLNNLSSLSEEEIKQLKAKPAEGTTPTSKTVDDNSLDLSEINANILSIKNNVSFFFWLTICSLALSMLVTLMAIA
jgi:hypothetical protein